MFTIRAFDLGRELPGLRLTSLKHLGQIFYASCDDAVATKNLVPLVCTFLLQCRFYLNSAELKDAYFVSPIALRMLR
jgi:hypothetical protein